MNYPWGPSGVVTSARVDIATSDNVTWSDAFQFDPPGPSGTLVIGGFLIGPTGPTGAQWTLTNNFRIDFKGNKGQTGPLLSIDSGVTGCQLVVVNDAVNRILSMNVSEKIITGATGATGATGPGLIPGHYDYDFIMYDNSSPPVRTALMHGEFRLQHGVSGG